MELKTAVGQMTIVSFPGSEWNEKLESLIIDYEAGGFVYFSENIHQDSAVLKELNRRIKKTAMEAPAGLPPFLSVDEEGGRISRLKNLIGSYPSALELGEEGEEAVYKSYRAIGEKVKGFGFNINWAPVLDINTNPQNPVIGDRSFGADVESVVRNGEAAIRAMKESALLACGKHFPGHGDTFVDSHISLPVQDTPLDMLYERELAPFRMAVSEGVDFIITAHILLTKVDEKYPVTFSQKFLKEILRGEMGYQGLIVTDDLSMGAVKENFSLEERIELSVKAGADILLIRDDYDGMVNFFETFQMLARNGKISQERIAESVERIRKIKELL